MPSRFNFDRRPLLPAVGGLSLLAVAIGLSGALTLVQSREQGMVQHTVIVQSRLTQVLSSLQDAETGQRGFLLTGRPDYLSPYTAAATHMEAGFADISDLTADNARQQAEMLEVRRLAAERMAVLQDAITKLKNGNRDGALSIVNSDIGKTLMDEIRGRLASMQREEARLLEERQASARRLQWWQHGALLGTLVLAFVLLAYVTWELHRRLQAATRSGQELIEANRKLIQEATARERLADQLRQSQKMEAVGQLTGGIAHDFNNMLAVVISAFELTRRALDNGNTDVRKFIEHGVDAARRSAALTQRLLAFARQQPLAPQPLDVNKLIRGMDELLRRSLGSTVRLETAISAGLWTVHTDQVQLENAILNLATNARDAMPDGGRLTIETANAFVDENYADKLLDVPIGQYVMIAVSDSGKGMDTATIAKAFDPFFTTKPVGQGTGLGLAQVYGFMKQTGGFARMYSEVGQGTTVKLYLPRFTGTPRGMDERKPAPETPNAKAGEAILLVEDDERVRSMTTASLQELGYHVVAVDGAAEALRHLSREQKFALILTDIVMPDMNGRLLADEAVRRHPGAKVLFMTGFTRNAVVHNGIIDDGVNYLQKPFTLHDLATKVRRSIES